MPSTASYCVLYSTSLCSNLPSYPLHSLHLFLFSPYKPPLHHPPYHHPSLYHPSLHRFSLHHPPLHYLFRLTIILFSIVLPTSGSVMACEGATWIIDPEFAFYGPMYVTLLTTHY